jgi:hypothetical protein
VSSTAPTTVPPAQSEAAAAATRSGAAVLRSRLGTLFQAHSYLVGLMTAAAAAGNDPAPARNVVDQNGAELASVVGEVFTPAAGQRFQSLWLGQLDLELAYTRAKVAGDSAAATQARAGLDRFRSDLAGFFAPLSPSLTTSTVTDLFSTPLSALLSAADAQVTRSAQQSASLHTAAAGMPAVAELLTRAFVKHAPDRYPGNPDSEASALLTASEDLLQEHVFLLAVTTGTQVSGGDVKAASNTLDLNSEALANVLVSAYGSAAGATFLSLWRGHIASFLDYARARLGANQADAAQAASRLDQFSQDMGAFLAGANPNLTRDQVASSMAAHVSTAESMIDAQAGHDPRWVAQALAAGRRMLPVGALVAGALAAQLPGRFTPT